MKAIVISHEVNPFYSNTLKVYGVINEISIKNISLLEQLWLRIYDNEENCVFHVRVLAF